MPMGPPIATLSLWVIESIRNRSKLFDPKNTTSVLWEKNLKALLRNTFKYFFYWFFFIYKNDGMALIKCLQLKQIHYGHTCFLINISKRDFSIKPHHACFLIWNENSILWFWYFQCLLIYGYFTYSGS